jgi:hypothetical protein
MYMHKLKIFTAPPILGLGYFLENTKSYMMVGPEVENSKFKFS